MEKEFDILTGAKRLDEVRFSKIRTVMDMVADLRAKGEKVLALSAGEPDFDTPAPIKEAVIKALEENYTHYGSNRGYPALRKLLSEKLEKETGVSYDPETEIIFTTGGAEALNNAFMAVVDPGDEVIVFSPAFITYENLVHMCGAKLVKVPLKKENNYQIDMDDLKAAVTDKTKLLVRTIQTTQRALVYSKECLEQVCELAKEKNFLILSDEMYSRLVYGDGKFYSIASFPDMKERTIIINGFFQDLCNDRLESRLRGSSCKASAKYLKGTSVLQHLLSYLYPCGSCKCTGPAGNRRGSVQNGRCVCKETGSAD